MLVASLGLIAATGAGAQDAGPVTADRASAQSDARASDPTPASAPAGTSRTPSEITVIAQRLKLESKVASYVYGVAALENEEGLPRWHSPVCPLVKGLSQKEGEFVLDRVSQIARASGAPLAREPCHPNLYIFVTTRPTELLHAMEQHYYPVTFGDAPPFRVDEFIAAPRPVRVWFNVYETAAGSAALAQGPPPSTQVLGGGMVSALSAPTYSGPGIVGASHLVSNVVTTFSYVYVVADGARLRGVSRGQFADYVALVSLAEIKTHPHLGDARSILTLFDGPPQAAPPGMSDWDRAFLKSLYGTMQESKLQRSLMTRAMVRDIAP